MASLSAAVLGLLLTIAVAATLVAGREADLAAERQRLLYAADMNVALQAWQENNVGRVLHILERHEPKAGETGLRGFEWYYLWRLCKRTLEARSIEVSRSGFD